MKKDIPVLLLTGYLGSGKTTLLNRILDNRRGIRFAVIVNDIGEVNIDASLIQKGGIVGNEGEDDLVALQNGCICCTLKMDLVKQLSDLCKSGKFDYIVIEASGICEPEPIAQTICQIPRMAGENHRGALPVLDCIVTVVDALRMQSEFGSGDALKSDNLDEEDIENLIIQQIEFCNIILLNKISEVSAKDAEHIEAIIRALQPKAEIIECDYADVDLERLLDTHRFDFEDVATSATWIQEIEKPVSEEEEEHAHAVGHERHEHHHEHEHEHDEDKDEHDEHEHGHHHHHHHHHEEGEAEEYGISTFVYYRRQPFDLNKFDWLCSKWPKSIIRTKGLVYFSNNKDMSYLYEQAGVQKSLREAGYWFATAPQEQISDMLRRDPQLRRDWDPVYGDRMIKLVIIGRGMDRAAITEALDDCLA
ncbi:MAG: GTP-binding protein [Muribaculaceae bacterium]|nr:GTP-binding protein [Muribaculaceae bacterium]